MPQYPMEGPKQYSLLLPENWYKLLDTWLDENEASTLIIECVVHFVGIFSQYKITMQVT